MKTVEKYLCSEHAQWLKDAGLIFKKVPGSEGERDECDWCGRVCYGARYKIRYGGRNETCRG